jgi:hypothetical protein
MRETLYTADVSGDNAGAKINFEHTRAGELGRLKRIAASDL